MESQNRIQGASKSNLNPQKQRHAAFHQTIQNNFNKHEKTEALFCCQVNLFKDTQLERDRGGIPTLASEAKLITSMYMHTYINNGVEKKILAPGKFKFAKSKQQNIQKSICLTKYSRDDIHS